MNSEVQREHLIDIDLSSYDVEFVKEASQFSSYKLVSSNLDQTVSSPIITFQDSDVLIIDSVCSGKGRTKSNDFYEIVMQPILSKIKLKYQYFKTDSKDSIANFAKTLSIDKNYTILFLSGDTSISELINNLPDTESLGNAISILPIPMGSGNAIASSLEFLSPIQTFKSFLTNDLVTKSFPLYKAIFPNREEVIFFIIFSMGFHANLLHLCTNHPKYSKLGVERFQLASKEILDHYDLNLHITVKTKLKTISFPFAYFAIINTSHLEPTYIPSPASDPLSQALHLLGYSSELSSDELVKNIMRGYNLRKNDLIAGPGIIYEQINDDFEIVVDKLSETDSPSKTEICCDGMLYNLIDMNNEPHPPSENFDSIKIKYLSRTDLPFNLNTFTNKNIKK